MLLKKQYDRTPQEGEKPDVLTVANTIEILRAGKRQNFSLGLVTTAQRQGWMTMRESTITLHGTAGDVVYTIVRGPGYHCCHCGLELPDDAAPGDTRPGAASRLHVATHHKGVTSPDPQNPAGYCRLDHYECVKVGD